MKPPMSKQASWLLSRKAKAKSPLLTPEKAIELLGTMQGGYNIHPLIDALDDANWHRSLPKHFLTRC
ncbi:bifunctional aconitate hydratase 2/2-methylisocitrate dehydratase [Escherichia coli]|uniref:Bifunctional aconitate hydratase 2/2-methylisocitrate dehydratase n=1 Tax=Escherichia coli TaxID=562 RepID=A0A376VNB2_ECOLX|nr:bifunctional aconitate hydratase 2/2-methylisocitrate dehydratase [Escherichia coli]